MAQEFFAAHVSGSNALLACSAAELRVLGATMPHSTAPDGGACERMVHLPEGQDQGLLAVAVLHRNGGDEIWSGHLIEVTREKDGCAHVHLDRPWLPTGAQLVQVDRFGIHVTDLASGVRFTTHGGTAEASGWCLVPNGDLLCAFLAGTKTVDELRVAARAHAKATAARARRAEKRRARERAEDRWRVHHAVLARML